MKSIYGSVYNFLPKTYIVPSEYNKMLQTELGKDEDKIWICKPHDLSRGRKIFLINNLSDLIYDQIYIV